MDVFKFCYVFYFKDMNYVQNLISIDLGKVFVSKIDLLRLYVKGYDLVIVEVGCIKIFDIKIIDLNGKQCYYKIDEIKVIVWSLVERDFVIMIDNWMLCGIYRVRYIFDCVREYEVIVFVND